MFRPNWLPLSGVKVVEETAVPLSRCYTSHFKGVKYLQNIFKISCSDYFVLLLKYEF
jgi:hypothetical protein